MIQDVSCIVEERFTHADVVNDVLHIELTTIDAQCETLHLWHSGHTVYNCLPVDSFLHWLSVLSHIIYFTSSLHGPAQSQKASSSSARHNLSLGHKHLDQR